MIFMRTLMKTLPDDDDNDNDDDDVASSVQN